MQAKGGKSLKIKLKDNQEFKKILLLKGYSQRKLADETNLSNVYINQIINNERNPSGKVAKKILDVLELEFDDIFFIVDACKSKQEIRGI